MVGRTKMETWDEFAIAALSYMKQHDPLLLKLERGDTGSNSLLLQDIVQSQSQIDLR